MTRLELFRKFHNITDDDYKLLEANLKPKSFKKGAHIIVPGQTQRELYFINSGTIISYFENDKKMHVEAFSYEPQPCAIPDSFPNQQPSRGYLLALTDCEVEYLTYTELQQLFDQSQAIERLFRIMTEFVLAGLISRHVDWNTLSITERFKLFCQRSPHLVHTVPHKYLASYLNIDPTNFSKLFNTVKF